MHDVSRDPILSLVLPVRDTELYIGAALASLQRNADPAFEFIVVDDGSVDATTQLVDDARSVLPALRVLRHDRAVGLAQARNAGVAAARGTYVTFLDGDDWLAPGYLRDGPSGDDGSERCECRAGGAACQPGHHAASGTQGIMPCFARC